MNLLIDICIALAIWSLWVMFCCYEVHLWNLCEHKFSFLLNISSHMEIFCSYKILNLTFGKVVDFSPVLYSSYQFKRVPVFQISKTLLLPALKQNKISYPHWSEVYYIKHSICIFSLSNNNGNLLVFFFKKKKLGYPESQVHHFLCYIWFGYYI